MGEGGESRGHTAAVKRAGDGRARRSSAGAGVLRQAQDERGRACSSTNAGRTDSDLFELHNTVRAEPVEACLSFDGLKANGKVCRLLRNAQWSEFGKWNSSCCYQKHVWPHSLFLAAGNRGTDHDRGLLYQRHAGDARPGRKAHATGAGANLRSVLIARRQMHPSTTIVGRSFSAPNAGGIPATMAR